VEGQGARCRNQFKTRLSQRALGFKERGRVKTTSPDLGRGRIFLKKKGNVSETESGNKAIALGFFKKDKAAWVRERETGERKVKRKSSNLRPLARKTQEIAEESKKALRQQERGGFSVNIWELARKE